MVADVHRQVIEDRACGKSLQSLDSNGTDIEGILRYIGTHRRTQRLDGQGHPPHRAKLKPHAPIHSGRVKRFQLSTMPRAASVVIPSRPACATDPPRSMACCRTRVASSTSARYEAVSFRPTSRPSSAGRTTCAYRAWL